MADVVISMRIMPESLETDMEKLREKVKNILKDNEIIEFKFEIKEVAFGLRSLELIYVADESKGGTEKLEEIIKKIPEVNNIEVTDVRRALG